jgi:phospholipid/cholesterol/gamma-HCH transport system substrate-binding protein
MKKAARKMDPETRRTLWLGVFVSVSILLLLIAVYFIGSKKQLFSSTFEVSASFSDVNGLQSGDDVRFRGITIGTVKKILVQNDSILQVVMRFDKSIKPYIRKNAVASIITDGLMGNKIVNIRNGAKSDKSIEANDVISTIPPIDVEDVTRKLKMSNDNISVITEKISSIADKINQGKGVIGALLTDSMMAKELRHGMRNMETGTANISLESEALKHNFLFRWFFKKKEKEKEKNKK